MILSPDDLLRELLDLGLSPNHALGWVANSMGESSLDPAAVGDKGTSIGLNQWHGPRADALKSAVPDWETNWRGQLRYAMTEPDTKAYLSTSFDTPEAATEWFTRNWERPANPDEDVRKRLGHLRTLTGSQPSTSGMQSPPTTGNQSMANRTLPPEFPSSADMSGAGIDLSPIEVQQDPSFTQRLMSDPLFMAGMGLLSTGKFSGALQGLQAAGQAERQYQEMMQNQIANENRRRQQQLYGTQLSQNYAKMMGMTRPSAWEQAQIQNMEAQRAASMREQELERFGNPQTFVKIQGDPDPVNVRFDRAAGQYRLITGDDDGLGNTVDISGRIPLRESSLGAVRQGTRETNAKEMAKGVLIDEAIRDFENLSAEIEADPSLLNAFGTVGELSERWWGRAKALRDVTGLDTTGVVDSIFGDDPTEIRRKIEKVVLPVTRAMVEPTGPISNVERGAARELLGLARDVNTRAEEGLLGKKMIGKEEAFQLLSDTMDLLSKVRNASVTDRGIAGTAVPTTVEEVDLEIKKLKEELGIP